MREILIVDGYNIIFAWPMLRKLSEDSLESARIRLADLLVNYQAFRKNDIILVFDGYRTKGNTGTVIPYGGIDIVYTKEALTADSFIEAVSWQMSDQYTLRVATGDGLEQMVILAGGAARMTAKELFDEIEKANREMRETMQKRKESKKRSVLLDSLPQETAEMLSKMRLMEDEPEEVRNNERKNRKSGNRNGDNKRNRGNR